MKRYHEDKKKISLAGTQVEADAIRSANSIMRGNDNVSLITSFVVLAGLILLSMLLHMFLFFKKKN
jgi:hypothetical protein